jgi:hypothetical protein
MRVVAVASLLFLSLSLPAARAQETARQAGEALREELGAAAPRPDLVGRVRLLLFAGEARAGAINLRTDVVERDGVQIYRLHDRLDLDLPGLGAARMLVQADLRRDLSAIEVVLETEEPRGAGAVSRQRVTLRRAADGKGWTRTVVRGEAAPVETPVEGDLAADVLVLTPPLGAGERLARLAPGRLGARLSVRGLDLETGQPATWRLSGDEERRVLFTSETGGAPVEARALLMLREEGAARLEVLRDPLSGAPWRVSTQGGPRPARLVAVDPLLAPGRDEPAPALAPVLALLRAACSGDRAAASAALDLDALHAEAGGPAASSRAAFEQVLLARLTDAAWLADRGLMVAALAAGADDFVVTPVTEEGPARARVTPRSKTGADAGFVVEERAGAWRVVRLPR